MTALKNIALVTAASSSFVFGFWLYQPKHPPLETNNAEIETQAKTEYTPAAFTFTQPFDARAELNKTLQLTDLTERYGRLIAIGYRAAQSDPKKNLAALSPEIWQYANYDLRGAFQAEWMRNAPLQYLSWAKLNFEELEQKGELNLFPAYHLAYMEPRALLELLPLIENPSLKSRLKRELLSTLVELDPALLWERREEVADATAIINEAAQKGHYRLALQFWISSEWENHHLDPGLLTYIAQEQLLEAAGKLEDYQRTRFAAAYAIAHPSEAALWVRAQPHFSEIEYSFDEDHQQFFSKLFALESFSSWADAPLWIREGINSDHDIENTTTLFSAIKSNPVACKNSRLKNSFHDYLFQVDDLDSIKTLYLGLENKHPILEVLESYMLQSESNFNDAIVKRTIRESPNPSRLMQVLELGNLDTWPEEYLSAARSTLNSLSDEQLLWNLSPSMILSAQEISPDRIRKIMATADPLWINSTLKNFGFIKNVSLSQLGSISTLVQDLPAEDAQTILASARASLFQKAVFDENKAGYLHLAQSSSEAIQVAIGIDAEAYQSDASLRAAIEQSQFKDDIYLSIASSSEETESTDPSFANAYETIRQAKALMNQGQKTVVSSIQSLPEAERFLIAKAALLTDDPYASNNSIRQIVDLPIWDEEQRRQLQSLSFKHYVNESLVHDTEFVW